MTVLQGSIQLLRKTEAEFAADNPVLLAGQVAISSDNGDLHKVGDGVTAWSALSYASPSVPVTSVFGRTGSVTAQNGDYTTSQVTEGTNLYWTAARFNASIFHSDTYANISALATAGSLIPGTWYKITDFATVHTIPNTAVTNTGATEPLILLAETASTFHIRAISETYKQDIIYYELVDSSTAGGTKGRIYYREDTLLNIKTWYDFRNVKFRKWENTLASTKYVKTTDPGGGVAYSDLYTFDLAGFSYKNIEIGRLSTGDQLNNITFQRSADNIYLGPENKNWGFYAITKSFYAGQGNENFEATCNLLGVVSGRIEFGNFNGTSSGSVTFNTGTLLWQLAGSTLKVGSYNAVGAGGILSFTGNSSGDVIIGNLLAQGVALTIGAGVRRVNIGTVSSISAIAITLAASTIDKEIRPGYSNFAVTNVSLTAASTTFDFTTARAHIGDITVTSTNATETISTLSNMPTNHPVIFRAATGKTITFNVAGNIKVAGGVSFSIVGTKGDFIVLERRADGIIYQIGGVNY